MTAWLHCAAGRLQLYSVDSALQLTLQLALLWQQQRDFSTLIANAVRRFDFSSLFDIQLNTFLPKPMGGHV